jgi:DNA-binding CsgD family transcriptional regulator
MPVASSSPASRADSRSAATERARIVSELTDRHAMDLESILATLRSSRHSDTAARALAIDTAASAMVALRTTTDRERSLTLEPVVGAFARLQSDLRPLVRFGGLDVQFVEPPATGRALPGEVAYAARAIVRSAVLALVDRGTTQRIRIQWDCDGRNLLVDIRDDGAGALTASDESLLPIAERVAALDGTLAVTGTPGWGSEVAVALPLDPPSESAEPDTAWQLSPRERDVLQLVVSGARNRAIAASLSISENTVKFHVANLLRKMGATTRAELAGLTR